MCRADPDNTAPIQTLYPLFAVDDLDDYRDLKNQFVVAAAAERGKGADREYDEARAGRMPPWATRCGFAKEWCITAIGEDAPLAGDTPAFLLYYEQQRAFRLQAAGGRAPDDDFYRLPPPLVDLVGDGNAPECCYAGWADDWDEWLDAQFAAFDEARYHGIELPARVPQQNTADGSSFSAPRVAAVAAAVIQQSGLEEAQAVQQVLFKTAYKCRTVEPGIGRLYYRNAVPTRLNQQDGFDFDCAAGQDKLDPDAFGHGLLNQPGAVADAASMRLTTADGRRVGRLRDARFGAASVFGDGLSSRLARLDLTLKADSGNRYHHRLPRRGLDNFDSAHSAETRAAGFARRRTSPSATLADDDGGGARLAMHYAVPFAFANAPDSATSGFSFAAAGSAFAFSYDTRMLPSVFDAGASLLPESHHAPFMDFVQQGWRAQWQRSLPLPAAVVGGA